MKTIEEKAKAYDNALKEAVIAHKDEDRHLKATLERIFPELKESEDENIRKELICFLETEIPQCNARDKYIAWLEKQSKASKVEQALREVEEKADAFTEAHKGETSDEILAQMRGEQKPTWSEEDKKMLEYAINMIEWYSVVDKSKSKRVSDWLKFLKDRVQPQPQQEWSEEDEKILNEVITNYENGYLPSYAERDEIVKRLKSIKFQTTWKPSEGQLECLGYAIDKAEKDWSPLTNNRIYLTLKALKEQLEKF